MSKRMVRVRRVDSNQAQVVQALRKIGVAVTHMHAIGHGTADLLASYRQVWVVLEVKDGSKPPSKRALTPDEKAWIGAQKAPVYIVTSPDEAVRLFRTLMPL